jgi:epoxyqueuosine reductase QueG
MSGLNNMLITESGCCGRIGSFVASLKLPADLRPREEAFLYRYNGSCARCASRCVGGALFAERFDRNTCYEVCLKNGEGHRSIGKAEVCEKCLVSVPCAFENPVQKLKGRSDSHASTKGRQ